MCIFNSKVKEVGGTKILVGTVAEGGSERQLTVYRNYVEVVFADDGGRKKKEKLEEAAAKLATKEARGEPTPAMLLPFPHRENADSKVTLVDLHEEKTLFEHLELCFPKLVPIPKKSKNKARSRNRKEAKLEVQRVGSYNVSVAYSLEDLKRIDRDVFIVADNVAELLGKHYGEDFGFIIACIVDNKEKHPLGYIHDLGEEYFVPTRHFHGGEGETGEETEADFDHEIYSVGAGAEAGESPKEMAKSMEEQAAAMKMMMREASMQLQQIKLPVNLKQAELRRLTKKGTFKNDDFRFGIKV